MRARTRRVLKTTHPIMTTPYPSIRTIRAEGSATKCSKTGNNNTPTSATTANSNFTPLSGLAETANLRFIFVALRPFDGLDFAFSNFGSLMSLSNKQLRALRARGHHLDPVVILGSAGLSKGVIREIDLSLNHHELMKIKVASTDRADRDKLINDICAQIGAELVQRVGHIALIYRARKAQST